MVLTRLDLSNKWKQKIEIQFEEDELENAFIANHRTDVNMPMNYIQYRILHYGIGTTRELVKMNITQDDKCGEVETFENLVNTSLCLDIHTLITSLGLIIIYCMPNRLCWKN